MQYARAFTFMFDDDKWIERVFVGSMLIMLSFVPLVFFFTAFVVVGYCLRLLNAVAAGESKPLPKWNDWGQDWIRGAMVALASLVYVMPIVFLWIFLLFISIFAPAGGANSVCATGACCIYGLYALAVLIVFPIGLLKYAEDGKFSSFFRFREIFTFIRDNVGVYLVILLLGIGASVAGVIAGSLMTIGAPLFLGTGVLYGNLVFYHLLGQMKTGIPSTDINTGAFVEPSERI